MKSLARAFLGLIFLLLLVVSCSSFQFKFKFLGIRKFGFQISPNEEKSTTASSSLGLGNLATLPDNRVTGRSLGREVLTAKTQWKKQIDEQEECERWLETFGSIL